MWGGRYDNYGTTLSFEDHRAGNEFNSTPTKIMSVYLICKLYLGFLQASTYPCCTDLASSLSSTMAEIHDQFDTILILDFGSQVCQCPDS